MYSTSAWSRLQLTYIIIRPSGSSKGPRNEITAAGEDPSSRLVWTVVGKSFPFQVCFVELLFFVINVSLNLPNCVSTTDTGLDVDNCHMKDQRGEGLIYTQWDYSRRKVIKYGTSTRGGDRSDIQKGHGTHVCGTVAGQHVLDGSIGDDSHGKEGVAPKAKLHFYDIGKGYAVNDPREEWFKNFHRTHAQRGAKIATGSWGFGYRYAIISDGLSDTSLRANNSFFVEQLQDVVRLGVPAIRSIAGRLS